jgi:hypothetical protein
MQTISNYPLGKVIATYRVQRYPYLCDIVQIKYGSMTRFVETIFRNNNQLSFRQTDEFPSDKIADTFIESWLKNKTDIEGYTIVSKNKKNPQ